jgi:DNA polymerase-3 subunit epsilon
MGVPEDLALNMLLSLWESTATPRLRAGHNESFDARIIRIACKRYHDDEIADHWKSGPAVCTARMAAPIVNLPPTERMLAAGRNHPKTPNLGECVQHFFGETLEGAHSAMVDVQACMRVYWAAQSFGREPAQREPA